MGREPSVGNAAQAQVLEGFEGAPFRGQGVVYVRAYLAILIALWAVHAKGREMNPGGPTANREFGPLL